MQGKYEAYHEYKDSGVEWLGRLPVSWDELPIKRFSEIFNGATPKSGENTYWDGNISWITPADLGKANSPYVSEGARSISLRGYESCGTSLVPVGTIVLSSRAPIGTLGIASKELCTNQGCKSLVVEERYSNKYLYYVLLSSSEQLNLLGRGTTFLELSAYELGSYKIGLPPKSEQEQIANFLDHETAKIDTLIERQKQLIKLLKEKRQAVISHAVTKGLNPHATMRDSGVQWLGAVPEHWGLGNSKWIFTERNTKALLDDEMLTASQKYGVISQKEFMRIEQQKVVQVQKGHNILKHVEPHDFVISMRSFQGGIEYCPIKGAVSSAYVPLVPVGALDIGYFKYLFKSKPYIQALQSTTNLVRDGQALRYSNFIQVPLPIVPLVEQKRIANFLDSEIVKIDELVKKSGISIELMQERRTALISAAVTGKIDVRHWQIPEQNQNNKEEAA